MGYVQSIIISSALDPATREQAIQSACSRWPFLRRPRRAEVFPDRLLLGLPELTDYMFDDHSASDLAHEQDRQVESELVRWSQEFPAASFADIFADCFGGTCGYEGFACQANAVVERLESNKRGHVILLRHVGIVIEDLFEPFRRVYFKGNCSGLPLRPRRA